MLEASVLKGLLLGAVLMTGVTGASHAGAGTSPPAPVELRCEYLVDPVGIDARPPRLGWVLPPGPRGRRQTAYQVLVAASAEALRRGRGDVWDSGRTESDQSAWVPYGGPPLRSLQRCFWKVRFWDEQGRPSAWSETASWTMGLLEPSDWHARFVGLPAPPDHASGQPLPFPWLRRTFHLDARPKRATAIVNPLGYYELYVNGQKVDDHVLSPAPTDFSRRTHYVVHDVTPHLRRGKNCVALWLGRGWYVRGHAGVIHDGPLVRAQLEIERPGGEPLRVATDGSWKVRASHLQPLGSGLAFGNYGGERVDARADLPNWNDVDLDDSGWAAAAVFDPPAVPCVPQNVEPNRKIETLKPARVREVGPGVYLFEMDRALVGWFQLRLPAGLGAGKSIRLDYSDFPLPAPGRRWPTHNQWDEYIGRGEEEQTFCSRFNCHGFQYVRVTGLDHAPSAEDATAWLIHTDYRPAGEFACSDPLLNRIHQMMAWTYRNLTLGGYVVDCPTRERLGYGGDAGTSLETGMMNFHAGALYRRWLDEWRLAQHPETGDLPYTAPFYQDRGGGGPMWSGFVVTLPWQLYLQYGDAGVLQAAYPMIERWLGFLDSKCRDGVLNYYVSYAIRLERWNFLGDWLAPKPAGGGPPQFGHPRAAQFINNCHYLYQLRLAARMAGALGRRVDAARYRARADELARLLHERFASPDGRSYATGEQPYLAIALFTGVVPEERREAVARHLEETIRVTDQGHINAGMHGSYFLLKDLMERDRSDLVHLMVAQRDFPGWGHMIERGATTSWEDWEGNGSRIHDTLISGGAWFYQGIGGIRPDPDAPGFRRFVVMPALVGDLQHARATYRSPYGRIVSDWRIEDGRVRLEVTVPPGSAASILLPHARPEEVEESGRPAATATGVKPAGLRGGRAAFEVDSGAYVFSWKLER